ncbi:MAG: hypothetical protein AB8C95_06830 [Phycisphaeraceae bacterium]
MTKQRKMLIGVLCLGVSGLVVDRLFLAAPESAAADDGEVIVEVPAEAPPLPAPQPVAAQQNEQTDTLPSYASLAERLVTAQQKQGLQADQTQNDPFDLPAKWQTDRSTPAFEAAQPTQGSGQRLTAVFKLDGTVRSVIDEKEEIMAVISGGGLEGRAIRVGQKIRVTSRSGTYEDYRLIKVGSRFVVWQSETTQETVEMKVDEVL